MQCEKLFAKIDELEQEYIQFWVDVCSIESPTKFKEGVDTVGKYFIDKAKPFGWEIEVRHEDVSGDAVCITMNPDAPGKAVCLSGHMDTVHPVGSFGTPPVKIEDGWIYGPGVKDCKGGAVASFYAMAALAAVGFKARPVKLICSRTRRIPAPPADGTPCASWRKRRRTAWYSSTPRAISAKRSASSARAS
ncbi:MAG: M20/M25/M40 family metallo-hydrolase [Oscillospiraceae bacterium]|nr:M20/M25/M40 family metallo-hydrolase [Oscillospiraceae bacterium]